MNTEERSYLNRSLFPEKGESSIIYIDIQNDLKYRWSLDRYVLVSTPSIQKPTPIIGTSDYNKLLNKPSINSVILEGNKSLEDLGIISYFEKININNEENPIWILKPLKIEGKAPGIVSESFISCRGFDPTVAINSGGITRGDLFTILSGEPLDSSEFINNGFLKLDPLLKDYATKDWVTSQSYLEEESDPTVPEFVKKIKEIQISSWDLVASLFRLSDDKSYISVTENRGFVSNSFISCKGLDSSAAQIGGGINEDDFSTLLFNILTGTPEEGQFINLAFLDLSSYAQKDWVNLTYATKTSLEEKANKTITLTAGNGLTGGGTLESNRTFALGTPSKITSKTTNEVTSESHTHEIDQASTSVVGIVKLYDALDSDSTILALTAKQGKAIGTRLVSLEDMWENKDTYLLAKNNRGIVSNSFISCKGLDETAPQVGGTFDRESLFDILSGEPQNGESINLGYLDLSTYATTDFVVTQGYITANYLTGYATEQWVKQQGYLTQHQDLSAYAKSADIANTYATKVALQTLQNEHNALSTKVTNLDNLLNSDVSGVINTWGEVVDFLDEYSGSEDLATILAGMNNDIANRVLIEDFEKLEGSVTGIAGYFTNGSANNALKLGGQLPSYYATKSALDTTNSNVVSLTQRMGTAEGNITTLQGYFTSGKANSAIKDKNGNDIVDTYATKATVTTISNNLSALTSRVSTAEATIKGHTDAIALNANNIASNAKSIATNATAITAVSNRVQTFEDVIGIDSNGDVYIKGTRNFYTAGGTIGMAGLGSGGGTGGGGTAGLGSVTVRVNGQDYITDASGIVTIPNYPSLAGYATEDYVTSRGYITNAALNGYAKLTDIPTSLPASDVYSWAKAASKPSYAFSEITSKPTTLAGYGITNAAVVFNGGSYVSINASGRYIVHYGDDGDWRLTSKNWAAEYKILHSGNYSSYALTLSGGTITGDLSVYNPNSGQHTISIATNNGTAWLGYNADNDYWFVTNKNWYASYHLYHSGNFNPSNYLPLSGGTIVSDSIMPLILDSNNNQSRLNFRVGGADKALVGWNSTYGAWLYSYPSGAYLHIKDDGTPCYNGYTLYHTGNFNPANYLPLNGGTMDGAVVFKSSAPAIAFLRESGTPYIRFGATTSLGYGEIGVNSNGDAVFWSMATANLGYNKWNTLIHSGNIGSYNAGSADMLAKSYSGNINFSAGSALKLIRDWGEDGVSLGYPTKYQAGLSVMTDFLGWQMTVYAGATPNPYFRSLQDTGVWKEWKQLAFLTDNVASATKLQTARTIWGRSFDGAADVWGGIDVDGYKDTHSVTKVADLGTRGLVINAASIRTNWGMCFWTEGNGRGMIQQQAFTSAATTYPICLQPFGGNILIGTTTDSGYKLDVRGGNIATDKGIVGTSGSTYNRWSITHGSNRLYIQSGFTDGSGASGDVWISGINTSSLGLLNIIATTMTLSGNFTATGDIISEGTITMARLASSSDRKLKDNIAEVSAEQSMSIIRQLRPTTWSWKKDGKKSYGFIAQEVEPIVPEMVVNMEHLHLEYNQLHAFEIGAIQHIDSEVEQLKIDLKAANKKIEQLESKLKQYELWQ